MENIFLMSDEISGSESVRARLFSQNGNAFSSKTKKY